MNIEINDGLKTIYVLRGTKVSELLEFLERNKKYVDYEVSPKVEFNTIPQPPIYPVYPATPYTPPYPYITYTTWCGTGVINTTDTYF